MGTIFFDFLGVNLALRKLGKVASSTAEITEEGENKIRIKIKSTVRSSNVLYTIGEEVDEHTMDGRDCKVRKFQVVCCGQNKQFVI